MPSSGFPRFGSGQGVPAYRGGGGLEDTIKQLLAYKPAYSSGGGLSNTLRMLSLMQRIAAAEQKRNAPPKLTEKEREKQEQTNKLNTAITELINDPVFLERYKKMWDGSTVYRDREMPALRREFIDKQATRYGVTSTDIYDRLLKPAKLEFDKHKQAVEAANDWGYTASRLKQGWDELWKPIRSMLPGGDADATARELEESQRKIEDSNLYAADLKKREQEDNAGFMPDTLVNTVAGHAPSVAGYIGAGMLGTAAAGAALGSVVPGIGTALGGLGGALAGLAGGVALTAPMGAAQSNVEYSRRILADPELTEEQKQAALANDSARRLAVGTGAVAGGFTGSVRPLAQGARSLLTRAGVGAAGKRVKQSVAGGAAKSEAMKDAAERWALAASQRGVARRMGLESVNQATGMAGLSAGQVVGSNAAYNAATGRDIPLLQGAGDAALSGAIMGGILGAPFGALRRVRRPQNRTDAGEVRDTMDVYAKNFDEAVEKGDVDAQKNIIADFRAKYRPETEPDAFAQFLGLANIESPDAINTAMRIYGNPKLAERLQPKGENAKTLADLQEVVPAKNKTSQEILSDLEGMSLRDGEVDKKALVALQKQVETLRTTKNDDAMQNKVAKLLHDAGFYDKNLPKEYSHDEILPFIEWIQEANAGAQNDVLTNALARHQRFIEVHRRSPDVVESTMDALRAAKNIDHWRDSVSAMPSENLPTMRQVVDDAPIDMKQERRTKYADVLDEEIKKRGGTLYDEGKQQPSNGEQTPERASGAVDPSIRTNSPVATDTPNPRQPIVSRSDGSSTLLDGADESGRFSGAKTPVDGANEKNVAAPKSEGDDSIVNTPRPPDADNPGSGEAPKSDGSQTDKGVRELRPDQLPEELGSGEPSVTNPVIVDENGKPKLYFNPMDSSDTVTAAMGLDAGARKLVFGKVLPDEDLAKAVVGTMPVVRKKGVLEFDKEKAAQLFKSPNSTALLNAWGKNPWSEAGVTNLMRNARKHLKLDENAPITSKKQLQDYAISFIESNVGDVGRQTTARVRNGC